jgi:hypothetical protein
MKTIPEEDGGVAKHEQHEPRTSSEPPSRQRPSVDQAQAPRNNGVNGFHKILPGEPSSKKAGPSKKKTTDPHIVDTMSLNLTVPVDTNAARPLVQKRSKNPPLPGGAKASSARNANRNSGISLRAGRSKSKSPNPSFCSVLSRVKDWEIGAFTPKTALADNVDVDSSRATNSDVSNNFLCPSDQEGRSAATPWRNSGSPEPNKNAEPESSVSKLQKSTLSSNFVGLSQKTLNEHLGLKRM